MLQLEEYQLKYDLFLAENELFESMISLGSDVVLENSGYISINESVKDVVMNYIGKVFEAIQNAWNKFKEIIINEKDQLYFKSIEKKINDVEPTFTINNYKDYDLGKLKQIKLIPFNYEEMKDSLKSSKDFIDKYYRELSSENSIKDAINNSVIKSVKDVRCTNNMIKDMYKFVTSDYKSEVSEIEKDLKTVNDSKKNIERLINTVTPAETAQESALLFESYIIEADDDPNKQKMSFEDDKKEENSENEKKNSSSSLTKDINVYMKTTSDILSAKLLIVKDVYNQYKSIIKHFIKPEKAEDDKKETKKEEQTNSSNNTKDIEI